MTFSDFSQDTLAENNSILSQRIALIEWDELKVETKIISRSLLDASVSLVEPSAKLWTFGNAMNGYEWIKWKKIVVQSMNNNNMGKRLISTRRTAHIVEFDCYYIIIYIFAHLKTSLPLHCGLCFCPSFCKCSFARTWPRSVPKRQPWIPWGMWFWLAMTWVNGICFRRTLIHIEIGRLVFFLENIWVLNERSSKF